MTRPPNVLLFITDQQRWDTLGYTGRTACRTPNLDRLALSGVAFDRCISPNPLCAPARAALFTGRYPHATGVSNNRRATLDVPALPELFRDAGYHVAYSGKWHLGKGRAAAAFHDWAGERSEDYRQWLAEHHFEDPSRAIGNALTYRGAAGKDLHRISTPGTARLEGLTQTTYDAWVADRTLEHLETRPADRPFFHVCSFHGPHPVFVLPEPYYSLYDPATIPEPPNFAYPMEGKPAYQRESLWATVAREHGTSWGPWQQTMAVYWGYVTLLDELIGRVLMRLEALGMAEDTIVVMTTDHGEMMGSHGLFQKRVPYEESVRVPLLIRAPGQGHAGRRITAPVSLTDVAPTLLALADLAEAERARLAAHGRDLSPWLTDHSTNDPSIDADGDPASGAVFSENVCGSDDEGMVDIRCAIGGRYKYVWNRGDREELYDTPADPYELCNAAGEPALAGAARALRRRLLEWMQTTDDPLASEFARSA